MLHWDMESQRGSFSCCYLSHITCQGMTRVGACCDVYASCPPCEMGFIKPSSLGYRLKSFGKGVRSTQHGQSWDLNPDGASLRAVVLSCAFTGIPH